MENAEYNRWIRDGNYDKFIEISYYRITDLVKYTYLGKTILEYMLEKNIHNKVMDNYAITKRMWINLYIKYHIFEPLLLANLKDLLTIEDNKLLLDKLLNLLNQEQKLILYQNIKKNNYWLFMNNEKLINETFLKHNIKFDNIMITAPKISDMKIDVNDSFNELLDEFRKTYSDHDDNSLNTVINELKYKVKIDRYRAINDIKLLIDFKKEYPIFKLLTKNITIEDSENVCSYSSYNKELIIDEYQKNVFNHEFCHLLYDEYEENLSIDIIVYRTLYQRYKANIQREKREEIKEYLKDFHQRYDYMTNIFKELYYREIDDKYGSLSNYIKLICDDIKSIKADSITIDKVESLCFFDVDDDEEIIKAINYLIEDACKRYVKSQTINYYREELFLENMLDAILDGDVFGRKCGVKCLSGHRKKYFKRFRDNSFCEALADYDAIKNSYRSKILINKLRSIVGNDLVDLFEDYLKDRKYKEKSYIKKR